MEIPTHEGFVDYVLKYLERSGEKPSSFGRRVLGDSAAIIRLIEGTDPRLSKVQKIDRAIKDNPVK